MNELDEFDGVRDLIPADCIPLSSVRVVRYLDAGGREQIRVKHYGDAAIACTVGMLEMAKQAYVTDAGPWEDFET